METTETKDFLGVFRDAIDQLSVDAKAVGSNITEVCREAGVSRTTPDRWKTSPPATVKALAKLQGVIVEKAKKKAEASD